jgi:DNA-binding CsgD family transcriptional regulator
MRPATSAKPARGHRPRPKEQEEPRAVETLVRQLVAHAQHTGSPPAHSTSSAGEPDEASDVLFDCEVDGVRCVLARAKNSRADAVPLSPRESEIARMIAKGYPNKTIASVLDISVWTVSTHLRRIFAKLGVTSRAAMVTTMYKSRRL